MKPSVAILESWHGIMPAFGVRRIQQRPRIHVPKTVESKKVLGRVRVNFLTK